MEKVGLMYFIETLVVINLILIVVDDIKRREISDRYTLSLGFIALFMGLLEGNLEMRVVGMGVYTLPFLIIYGYFDEIFKKEVMGFGDIKLVMGIGGVLGFSSLKEVYFLFTLSFIWAFIYIVLFYLLRRVKCKTLPFAPFISLAGLTVYLIIK